MKRTDRFAGWFQAEGTGWQKVAEGTKLQCLDALLDLAEPGAMSVLPAGEVPRPGQRGQFSRGEHLLGA